jgi:uncharacterized protein (TIGR02145 family)
MKLIYSMLIILLCITTISCEKEGPRIDDNNHYVPYVKTLSDTVLIDIDSNRYKIISINDKKWMAENLRVTRYRNGDTIPFLKSDYEWKNADMGGYTYYNNDSVNLKIYGNLYSYTTIQWGDVCPDGWHLPTKDEWHELESALGGSGRAGGNLKAAGTDYWHDPNKGATDSVEFSALPGGIRNGVGPFNRLGEFAFFLSSTDNGDEVYVMGLKNDNASSILGSYHCFKRDGYSVRCKKDVN